MDTWIGAPLPRTDRAAAQAELARRWLRTYGPGTLKDISWWTGWTLGDTRRALAATGVVEVELDEGTGFALSEDLESTPRSEPWIALLPALDSTTMGWKERSWFLGPHAKRLFDVNGNAGPTVWSDGRVVGGWAQRRSGEVAIDLLENVGTEKRGAIEEQAERVRAWLGATRIVPRFRTPIETALAA